MANDSSLGGAETHSGFDFESQKGITILLASSRESNLSKSQKSEIRDLVFEYTNGGRHVSTKLILEQKIKSFGLQPIKVSPNNASGSTVKNSSMTKPFGMSRPSPSFSPSFKKVEPEEIKLPTLTPTPTPTPTPQPEPVKEPVVAPAPTPQPEPVIPSESIIAPTPVPEVVSKPEPRPTESAPAPSIDADTNLTRIKEIKSLVNQKVGNPVNLVDINNEVGREYMSAMLDAMKTINTGSAGVPAMQRLEVAYQEVEKTLRENTQAEPKKAPEPVAKVPVPVSASVEPKPVQAPHLERKETPVEPAPAPVLDQKPVVPSRPAFKPVSSPIPTPAPETATQNSAPRAQEEKPKNNLTHEESADSRWDKSAEVAEPVKAPVSENGRKSVSVGDNPIKLKTPNDLPEASSIETSSVSGDPLFTNEVDEGLDQLLVEWPIFKKSGLFGTGPKGRQHPLFIKLSGLQIPLLLAGRFEGATQEIKQSITDYMNGWRYEQGIIYNHGENFEHYLRRVIRHIIDLQNK